MLIVTIDCRMETRREDGASRLVQKPIDSVNAPNRDGVLHSIFEDSGISDKNTHYKSVQLIVVTLDRAPLNEPLLRNAQV